MASLKLTFLGSGTSMGVPTIGCECRVCRSTHPHDRRTRPSVLLSYAGPMVGETNPGNVRDGETNPVNVKDEETNLVSVKDAETYPVNVKVGETNPVSVNVVVDTTPDFRYQALRAGIKRLDAVLYTHGHADHILGLDDIRPFNLKQRADIPVYASAETLAILRRTFAYIFDGGSTMSTVPGVMLNEICGPFDLFGARVTPIPARHGDVGVLGFRVGALAYLTDFSVIPPASMELLRGLDHVVLDALRHTPHPMHSTVKNSLELVADLQPHHAWFTHIAHELGHEETNATLPAHVRLAYDGLSFEVDL